MKSYVGYYDPFCELLQNAMDATDRMAHIVGNEYRKRLKKYIDLSENSIYVADNGIGFETEQFRAFLSPNVGIPLLFSVLQCHTKALSIVVN